MHSCVFLAFLAFILRNKMAIFDCFFVYAGAGIENTGSAWCLLFIGFSENLWVPLLPGNLVTQIKDRWG